METVRKALEDALGLKVTDAKGEHFFQSTLVQTLFYGVFSAWVLWHRSHESAEERFDWERSPHYLRVPILRKLFRELTDPEQLRKWDNLTEVMGWAADALNRVDRAAFFAKFKDAEAVQYFYEPFLEAFDNGFAGLPAEEEAGLVEPYRKTKTAPKPQGQGLNDLYVRFFRIAERCITERQATHGIACLPVRRHTPARRRFASAISGAKRSARTWSPADRISSHGIMRPSSL
jgi:hypothetical protein